GAICRVSQPVAPTNDLPYDRRSLSTPKPALMTARDKTPSRTRRWARRIALLGGAGAAGFVAFGAWLSWRILRPPRTPGSGTPDDHGLEYEPVTIPSTDGIKLDAWYMPRPGAR